jgi:hypothetical protein
MLILLIHNSQLTHSKYTFHPQGGTGYTQNNDEEKQYDPNRR